MAQYCLHETQELPRQAGGKHAEHGSAVALYATRDPAGGSRDMPITRMVVCGVSRTRGLRVWLLDAIKSVGGYGLPGACWRDHAPRGQRVTEKANPCALQVCQPTWESLGGKRYDGQSSVSQFADRGRVQDVRAKQTVGRGTHDLLAEIACLIKILICAARSNAVTPKSITRKTESASSKQRSLTNDYGARHGMRTKHHFHALIAASAILR
jgi:hypothetical protein